jgi:hypothetical protein
VLHGWCAIITFVRKEFMSLEIYVGRASEETKLHKCIVITLIIHFQFGIRKIN